MAKKSDENFTVLTTTDNTPPEEPTHVTIPLQTALNSINIIDMISTRGGFKGDELLGIGVTRQALFEAIKPHMAPQ